MGFEIKRKNGVFRGWEWKGRPGESFTDAAKRKIKSGPSMKEIADKTNPGSVSVKNKGYNDRGTWQGVSVSRTPHKGKSKRFGSTSKPPTIEYKKSGTSGKFTTGGKEIKPFGSTSMPPTQTRSKTTTKTNKDGSTSKVTKHYETGTTGVTRREAYKKAAKRKASERTEGALGLKYKDRYRTKAEIKSSLDKRAAKGKYKGKYVGPDRFKGDTKKIAAWRKSGRKY